MAESFSISTTRTSVISTGDQLLSALSRTQSAMNKLQQQISTGRKLTAPSDAPTRTSTVLMLEAQLEAREQYERNLQHALGVLNTTDAALADGTDILLEAKSIASSQVGIGSDAATRANQATIIDAQIRALIDLGNRQFQGVSLFGGNRGAGLNGPVFIETLGGVRYVGGTADLTGDGGNGRELTINSNGQAAFGALSSRVEGYADLNPLATAATNITDVNGAQGVPVRLGSITVDVNGTPATVELGGSHTLGDVILRVNEAINSIDPTAGALSISGSGFALNANFGHTITISDIGSGESAADLGVAITASSTTTFGGDLDPQLTTRTALTALGVAVDLANGLKITQGSVTKAADFSSAQSIEDLINEVDQLGMGLRMQVNGDRTGLNLVSEVSGISMTIGENGGTGAEDLGLRTFGSQTLLSDFRFNIGVETQLGADDFAIELHDGRSFNVNLDGVATVGEVVAAVNAAAGAAGLVVGVPGDGGTDINIGLASDGNGFVFEDGTAGANDFRVRQLGISLAATHLGINKDVKAASQIIGDDVVPVRAESVLTHLIHLRDSLIKDDSLGITLASEQLDLDLENFARVRADVGSRALRTEQQQERSSELKIAETQLLGQLRDTDLTEAVTLFAQLQQQLQSALSIGSANLQLSLIDFLR